MIDQVATVLALLASLSAGAVAQIIASLVRRRRPESEDYSARLSRLTSSLNRSSKEMDKILAELGEVAVSRQRAVEALGDELSTLSKRQKELEERNKELANVSMPVAEYFASIASEGEKRSARRDFLLFGLGVVVSTVVTLLLQ